MQFDKDEEDIFNEALDITDLAERKQFLTESCGSDQRLRDRVDRLLATFQLGDALEPVAEIKVHDLARSTSVELIGLQKGDFVGPYSVQELLGEGGMGYVYRAEQTSPVSREVALKVIKPGMDTCQVLARFEAERQSLAMMDHPGITKIIDVGATEQGLPYFVMDLIKGQSITKHCDQHQLTVTQRLGLFVDVCRAVQHAHQKGVIHRDLNPSNILVTMCDELPTIKVIDFGLAKSVRGQQPLSKRTLHTHSGQILGTPEYMSPEQARLDSATVDTRTDVYALGVLLFELLCGSTPFQRDPSQPESVLATLQRIRESDAPRVSSRLRKSQKSSSQIAARRGTDTSKLMALLQGDLDWIVMKALDRESGLRYDGAAALADDITRYLNNQPITARPPTPAYLIGKTLRRHKTAFAAAGVLVAALGAGVLGTSWMWMRAVDAERRVTAALDNERQANEETARQRDELQHALQRVEEERAAAQQNLKAAAMTVDDFFITVSEDQLLNLPDLLPLREQLLEQGKTYYQSFLQDNQDNTDLLPDLAAAHFRIAQSSFKGDLVSLAKTTDAFMRGIVIFEDLLQKPVGSVQWSSLERGVYRGRMRFPPGEEPGLPGPVALLLIPTAERACRAWGQLSEQLPGNDAVKSDLAGMLNILALLEHSSGKYEKAIASYEQAIDIWDELRKQDSNNMNLVCEVAMAHMNLTKVFVDRFESGDDPAGLQRAVEFGSQAVELHRVIIQKDPQPSFVIDFSASSRDLVHLFLRMERLDAAAKTIREARDALKQHGLRKNSFVSELSAVEKLDAFVLSKMSNERAADGGP